MGFPSQEYWSGLPFHSPGDLPDPGIEPTSPALACGFFTSEPPGKPCGVNKSRIAKAENRASNMEYRLLRTQRKSKK